MMIAGESSIEHAAFRWSAGSDHCARPRDRWDIGIHDVADLREAGVACRKSRVHGVDRIDAGGVPCVAFEKRQVGAPSLRTMEAELRVDLHEQRFLPFAG